MFSAVAWLPVAGPTQVAPGVRYELVGLLLPTAVGILLVALWHWLSCRWVDWEAAGTRHTRMTDPQQQ
jgi:hypothetical protein